MMEAVYLIQHSVKPILDTSCVLDVMLLMLRAISRIRRSLASRGLGGRHRQWVRKRAPAIRRLLLPPLRRDQQHPQPQQLHDSRRVERRCGAFFVLLMAIAAMAIADTTTVLALLSTAVQ